MASINLTTRTQVSGDRNNTTGIETITSTVSIGAAQTFAYGTGAGQADLVYSQTVSLNASATLDLDLKNLNDTAFGSAINMAKVKYIVIYSKSASNKVVTVGGATTDAWTGIFQDASDLITIQPGGFFVIGGVNIPGYATGESNKVLRLTNASGGASELDILIVGASA